MHTSDSTRFPRFSLLTWCWSLLLALMLSACGGGNAPAPSAEARQLSGGAAGPDPVPADYGAVVQQLYVAYFGRPADASGLANFEAQLQAAGAPAGIQALASAYNSNPALRTLIDTLGNSTESQTLYGAGNHVMFIGAVYNNVLSRDPLIAGLDFWAKAMDPGGLPPAEVALSITAAALSNSSAQGQLDAALIGKKVAVAQIFTAQVPAASYRGKQAAIVARTLLNTVTADTDLAAFQTYIDQAIHTISNQ